MKKFCCISSIVLVILIIIALILGIVWYRSGLSVSADSSEEASIFRVEEGWGVANISKNLKDEGYINSELIFKLYVFFSGNRNKLQAGSFEISSSMTIPQIVEILTSAQEKQIELTIIEGQRFEEVGRYLDEQGIKGDFEARAKISNFQDEYDFLKNLDSNTTLEGFLFPNTYKVDLGSSVDDVIKKMLDSFELKLKELPAPTNPVYGDLKDLVILASIIEREATMSNIERRRIAGVYINRLQNDSKLQADPTVQYSKDTAAYIKSNDRDSFVFWEKITTDDYERVDSGYNTYKIKGLPPTPICSPSFGSLTAAFNPERNNYYFFFHTDDGAVIFSETAEEHGAKLEEQR